MAARKRTHQSSKNEQPDGAHGDPGHPGEPAQRECARSQWCAGSEVSADGQGKTVITPARGYRAFCDADEKLIAMRLAELPGFYRELTIELRMLTTTAAHAAFGPRLPFRADVEALMRLLVDVLASWEQRVRDVGRLTPLDMAGLHRDGYKTLSESADFLGPDRYLGALLALQAGPMTRTLPARAVEDELAGQSAEEAGARAAIRKGLAPEVPQPGRLHWIRGATVVRRGVDDITLSAPLDGVHAGHEILALHYRCKVVLGLTDPRPEELLGVDCYQCVPPMRTLRRADPPQTADEPLWYSQCKVCHHRMTREDYDAHVKRLAGTVGGRKQPQRLQ